MTPLKDILGKPGEGVHFHACGIAIVDVLATIAAGCLLGWWRWRHTDEDLRYPLCVAMVAATILLLYVGESLHLLIGVDTTVARALRTLFRERP